MWLALDSSTDYLSLALVERTPGGSWAADHERIIGPHRKQSELLPQAIADFLAQSAVPAHTLSGVVVGLGPGSFTGLRVGLAWAKGMAYAFRLPLAGASSLAATALHGEVGKLLLPVAVSRKGELYVGEYRRVAGSVEPLAEEHTASFSELAERVRSEPTARVMGPAVAAHRAELLATGIPVEQLTDGPAYPPARGLATLAEMSGGYDFQRLAALEPHYVGTSGAERNAPKPLHPSPRGP